MDYASVYAGGGAGGAPAMAAAGGAGGGAGAGAADATLSVDWGEARTYINDIIMLYESDTEETKVLAQIKQLRADIAAMAAGRETDAKKVIMGALRLAGVRSGWLGWANRRPTHPSPPRHPRPPTLQSCNSASAARTRTQRR